MTTASEARDRAAGKAAAPADALSPDTPCRHCGLPLGRAWRSEYGPFCCTGCQTVYALIHEEGLADFYRLRRGPLAPPPRARADGFAWFERLLEEAPQPQGMTTRRVTLDLQGVHCAACIWLLEELLARHPGGLEIRINPSVGRAEITWHPDQLDLTDYLREAERFGYRFGPPLKRVARTSRRLLVRLGVCVAATMNVMIFTLCFYFGMGPTDGALYTLFGWLNLALCGLVVGLGGATFFLSATRALRRGLVHLDLPIALGIGLGFSGSVVAFLAGGGRAAYFDTISVFVTLMLVGRWLQERILERNRLALLADDRIENLSVRRSRDGRLEIVAAGDIRTGDTLHVLPGDLVPVAGRLTGGDTVVALDWITGESEPHVVAGGQTVPAGAFHAGRKTMTLEAIEPFSASRLVGLLGAPASTRPVRETGDRWWRRVATVYVAAVLALGALAFGLWAAAGWERALQVTVAVLVVTCPCALGLATPLAHELVHAWLRRRGIFLRDAGFLHRARDVRKVLFDKTGTLTPGRLRPTEATTRALAMLDEEARAILFNMTALSHHPVTRSVHEALAGAGTSPAFMPDLEVIETPGEGLELDRRQHRYRLGRRSYATEPAPPSHPGDDQRHTPPPPASGSPDTAPADPQAGRCAWFTIDGRPLARLEHTDVLRDDATAEIARLRRDGYEVRLLSGDHPQRVRTAARRLGLTDEQAIGGLTPEAKRVMVERIDRHDTLMVGDGVNDAPAFAAAWCRATPAVDRATIPDRADFYYLGTGVAAVRQTLEAAHRCQRIVRDNLVFAVTYNTLAVGLCLVGLVGPVLAAILMPLSSVSLVAHTTWRLSARRFPGRPAD